MNNRDLGGAYEPLKKVIEKALIIAKKRGFNVIITSVWRSPSTQHALWVQGRKTLGEVNKNRAAVGLASISKEQNKKITWTKKSYHNCMPKSMAVDFCLVQNKKAVWDIKADINENEIPDYEEFGDLCKFLDPNIEWGGDWKKKDYCHIQWKDGININQDEVYTEKEKKTLISAIIKLIEFFLKKVKVWRK